jgi:putative transposase
MKGLRCLVLRVNTLSANSKTDLATMYRISRLQELIKGLPSGVIDRIVEAQGADKYSKGFGCRHQLVAMLYAQLAGVSSLRELASGFNSQSRHHYHLGVDSVRRSTLSDANRQRSPEVFAEIARWLMSQASRGVRRDSQELLYLLDSTSISLTGRGFDEWTAATRTRHTQGIKVHVLYAAHDGVPSHQRITAANVNDVEEGKAVSIEAGATYVFDKGYCDYNWWWSINEANACFVTRFKYNAALIVDSENPIAPEAAGTILEDTLVRFRHRCAGGHRHNRYAHVLRRIVVARPDKDRPLILATNDLTSPAEAIARLYKDRWQIELFFKWIKQHLKVKRFLGRSQNAVHIQILTALISYLLLALYQKRHGLTQSLWQILMEFRPTLFQRQETEVRLAERRRKRHDENSSHQMAFCL